MEATYLNRFDDPAALRAGLRLCSAESRPHTVKHISHLGDRVLQRCDERDDLCETFVYMLERNNFQSASTQRHCLAAVLNKGSAVSHLVTCSLDNRDVSRFGFGNVAARVRFVLENSTPGPRAVGRQSDTREWKMRCVR